MKTKGREDQFAELDSIFNEFESFTNLEHGGGAKTRHYRLERMERWLGILGNPQQRFRAVHIAGSKGKGSTAAMTDAVLRAGGETVGRYTSPHITSYRERICIQGEPAPMELLLPILRVLRQEFRQAQIEYRPTTFEALTLAAFLCFAEAGLDRVVVETGLGGRLDATNLVLPELVVITPIELEHTEYLGTTIAEIASEKAGIIKDGIPVVAADLRPEAEAVIRRRAEEGAAPLSFLAPRLKTLSRSSDISGDLIEIVLQDPEIHIRTRLQMRGRVQAQNAALATLAVTSLRPELSTACIEAGLAAARLPARGELFLTAPPVMLDGAHTSDSVNSVYETFGEVFPGQATLIFGAVEGKDIQGMLARLPSQFTRVIISRPGRFRPSNPEAIRALCVSMGRDAELIEEPHAALASAGESGLPILILGSFFLAGEFRPLLTALEGAPLCP
ncbi:MAG: bifunctional folylpolyglutamate synthase/dihydrofolate synthase [Spirochaetaceae bacterium]|nr:MAG: bifunctional folylpolyglutamate synthase/dihydrofolate synthase [Spirochaetaceae bacterium]